MCIDHYEPHVATNECQFYLQNPCEHIKDHSFNGGELNIIILTSGSVTKSTSLCLL